MQNFKEMLESIDRNKRIELMETLDSRTKGAGRRRRGHSMVGLGIPDLIKETKKGETNISREMKEVEKSTDMLWPQNRILEAIDIRMKARKDIILRSLKSNHRQLIMRRNKPIKVNRHIANRAIPSILYRVKIRK